MPLGARGSRNWRGPGQSRTSTCRSRLCRWALARRPRCRAFRYELGALGGPLSGRGDAGGGSTARRGYRAVRGGHEPDPQANGTGDYHWDHA